MKQKTSKSRCPCGSNLPLSQCCEPYINNTSTAPTAEALMRSRYTAYTLSNDTYLLETWHSSTRPVRIDMDASLQWVRLEIINSEHDRVEFIVTYKIQGKAHRLHENSRFVFEDQKWFYLDAL
jgi:SEC-C motif-containing protein